MTGPIDELSVDLGWRESELGLIKLFLQKKDVSKKQHEVLTRAAWSLLYAHYEGFAKFSLSVFFDHAARLATSCNDLPGKTKILALKARLKAIRSMPEETLLAEIESFSLNVASLKPTFPEVDTQSNLWPAVLEKLLETADIECPTIDRHRTILKSLVGKRNGIAHGEAVQTSYADYITAEDAVYDVIYDIALQVDARLKALPYA